jgi:hypothetical protein
LDNQLNKPNHETTIIYFNPNFSAGLTAQEIKCLRSFDGTKGLYQVHQSWLREQRKDHQQMLMENM